jgi:hypothetical protein
MIPPHYSHRLAGLIPHARPKIYPDRAAWLLFQHAIEFAADVESFRASSAVLARNVHGDPRLNVTGHA